MRAHKKPMPRRDDISAPSKLFEYAAARRGSPRRSLLAMSLIEIGERVGCSTRPLRQYGDDADIARCREGTDFWAIS